MAQTKKRKPVKPLLPEGEYCEKKFELSWDDTLAMTLNTYFRLLFYKNGSANIGDRITLKIRIYVGLHLLKNFECGDAGIKDILTDAIDIVQKSWDSKNREIKVLSKPQKDTLGAALVIVHTLVEESSLWEQAQAYKAAEDICLPHAKNFEYILLKSEE